MQLPPGLSQTEALQLWEHFQTEAFRYKDNAWTQVTWATTVSGALLAFSVTTTLERPTTNALLVIQIGVLMMAFALTYVASVVTRECGEHMLSAWDAADQVQAIWLARGTPDPTATAAKPAERPVPPPLPTVINRLRRPLWMFLAIHIVWMFAAQMSR